MAEDERDPLKKQVTALIPGFLGYTSQGERLHSLTIFKKNFFEKIRSPQKILEKNYDQLTKNSPDSPRIPFLLDAIRTFTKYLSLLEKDLKRWPFLCEEIRLPYDEELMLYKQDLAILQNLSNIENKISSFQIDSDQIFNEFHQNILALKTHLEEKEICISKINTLLEAASEELEPLLKEISTHKASLQTYEALQKQIEKNPSRWNTYRDILETFRTATQSYLSLKTPTPPHAYEQAIAFLDAYERFCKSLLTFLGSASKLSEEEKKLWNAFSEKLHYVPAFTQERTRLKGLLNKISK
jgi:DNA repair exonuclease SbcCD ATPase subunit